MKPFTLSLVSCFVAAAATTMTAQNVTNTLNGLVPTNNIVAARSKFPLSNFGRIAPTTPAFEEYGLNFMLGEANRIRDAWKLEIPSTLTVDDVLFQLRAAAKGLDGGLATRDNRYEWSFARNAVQLFRDNAYASLFLSYRTNELTRLSKVKSKITKAEAEMIATDGLHRLGLSEKQLHLSTPPIVDQVNYEDSDNRVHFLPLFKVSWRSEEKPVSDDDSDFTPVTMKVSGITMRIVEYFNALGNPAAASLPTNYFQMLGLPENYLESIPAQKRALWGLSPLTNSSPNATK